MDIVSDAPAAIAKYEQGVYDIYGYGGFSNASVADIEAPHFSQMAVTSLLISSPWPLRSEVSQSSCRHSRAAQNQG